MKYGLSEAAWPDHDKGQAVSKSSWGALKIFPPQTTICLILNTADHPSRRTQQPKSGPPNLEERSLVRGRSCPPHSTPPRSKRKSRPELTATRIDPHPSPLINGASCDLSFPSITGVTARPSSTDET